MKPEIFLSVLSILAISVPLANVASIAQPVHTELYAQAVDITSQSGEALFVKDRWEIKIFKDGNRYIYAGGQVGSRGIRLTGGRLTKSGGKHFYKWNNAGTVYQVTWQPQDPLYARIQVFNPRGSEIFNNLMWTPIGD
ncbi:hypothetical protein [Chamaesiphon sp. VAR_48_metabat_135_sub]|uniref:hypothetical protein n=1 Tax=Chamaesiphon sp. VAR_48_metabat_135_sub TaxID=2964699 RepID=UPI00286CD19A|nr:hypothetical protein [Chamaesiphon sp. VAR_48_metabat_135_sub]